MVFKVMKHLADEQAQAVNSISDVSHSPPNDALGSACQALGIVPGNITIQDGHNSDNEAEMTEPPTFPEISLSLERKSILETENAKLRARVAELEDQLMTGKNNP